MYVVCLFLACTPGDHILNLLDMLKRYKGRKQQKQKPWTTSVFKESYRDSNLDIHPGGAMAEGFPWGSRLFCGILSNVLSAGTVKTAFGIEHWRPQARYTHVKNATFTITSL